MGVKRPAATLLQREFLRLFQGAKVPTSVRIIPDGKRIRCEFPGGSSAELPRDVRGERVRVPQKSS